MLFLFFDPRDPVQNVKPLLIEGTFLKIYFKSSKVDTILGILNKSSGGSSDVYT